MASCLIRKLPAPRICNVHRFKSAAVNLRANASSSDVLDMPPCDVKPQPYKGPSYEEVRRLRQTHLSSGLVTFYKQPVLINQGHMQWLFDHTGRRYLDFFAGIVTVSVGHCHPKVLKTLEDQVKLLWHTTNIYMHPRIHEYAEKLTAKLPGDLKVAYFVNSGSEANDLAMMMARLYTGRFDVISFRNAYHGTSPNLQALTAISSWRMPMPSAFGIQQTMNPDVYRGPWGGSNCRDSPVQADRQCDCAAGQCQACDMYIDQLKDVLGHSTPKQGIAAFFAEPVQGVGGTAQYPKDYLKRAYELTRQQGGLCISDEVQTGFGRMGSHYWGFETHDVMPDIVTMAKGIGNGFPMAAVVTTKEIASTLSKALHFNTYGGNPMACAVGSTVLDVLEEDKCQQICEEVGTHLLNSLASLRDEFEIVGDVRGKGLMIGLELVKDKASRDPLPAEEVASIWEATKDMGLLVGKGGAYGTASRDPLPAEEVASIWEATKDMGLLVGKGGAYGTCLRIKPPMCVTKADADFAVSVLRKALKDHTASK